MMKLLCTPLLTILVAGCAGSRPIQSGAIAGIVCDDSTGRPIPAQVKVASADRIIVMDHENRGEWEGAFEASSRGPGWRFILKDISPGAYVVSAAFLGYLRTVETLKVVAGDTTKVTLRLRRDPRYKNVVSHDSQDPAR